MVNLADELKSFERIRGPKRTPDEIALYGMSANDHSIACGKYRAREAAKQQRYWARYWKTQYEETLRRFPPPTRGR